MSKPFQFSARGMLAAMVWACATAWLFKMAGSHALDGDRTNGARWLMVIVITLSSIIGAAVGLTTGRPIIGAMQGAFISVVAIVALLLLMH